MPDFIEGVMQTGKIPLALHLFHNSRQLKLNRCNANGKLPASATPILSEPATYHDVLGCD